MGARTSQEMKNALALIAGGMTIRQASRESGVWFTSVHVALKKIKEKEAAISSKTESQN